jgi:hypothetical protein
MGKQTTHDVQEKKSERIIIEINPFDIEQKVRKPIPPASRFHKDKSKYTRKQKHGRGYME